MKRSAALILIILSLFYLAAEAQSAINTVYLSDGTPPVPTNVQASDGTYVDKVRVSWAASPGATLYKVYRAKSSNSWIQRLLWAPHLIPLLTTRRFSDGDSLLLCAGIQF